MLLADCLTRRAQLAFWIATDEKLLAGYWDYFPLMYPGCHYQGDFHYSLTSEKTDAEAATTV
jgi:hypothetical protein